MGGIAAYSTACASTTEASAATTVPPPVIPTSTSVQVAETSLGHHCMISPTGCIMGSSISVGSGHESTPATPAVIVGVFTDRSTLPIASACRCFVIGRTSPSGGLSVVVGRVDWRCAIAGSRSTPTSGYHEWIAGRINDEASAASTASPLGGRYPHPTGQNIQGQIGAELKSTADNRSETAREPHNASRKI
jgi:hypothetical protein